jgi:hypothetical protein
MTKLLALGSIGEARETGGPDAPRLKLIFLQQIENLLQGQRREKVESNESSYARLGPVFRSAPSIR